ncbi:MAG: hypothetical protein SF182_27850 [Deltaproteobacteria bacterium]|nr:hypothetical protein [Deltaproteobacteria bacterium]
MGHVQLWHSSGGVSVLTPSRLTGNQFEIYPIDGWKRPSADTHLAATIVRETFALRLPGPARMTALGRWFGRIRGEAIPANLPAKKKVGE